MRACVHLHGREVNGNVQRGCEWLLSAPMVLASLLLQRLALPLSVKSRSSSNDEALLVSLFFFLWFHTPQFLAGPAEIPENEITYNENDVLGKGTFGKVYRGRCRAVDVAVKVPKKRRFTTHQLEAFKKVTHLLSFIHSCIFSLILFSTNQTRKCAFGAVCTIQISASSWVPTCILNQCSS